MLTGNKGEWSEIYAFLKLLGDKILYSGDANLNIDKELFYPIIKIIRNENNIKLEFTIFDDSVIITGGDERKEFLIEEFKEFAQLLLQRIGVSNKVFSVPEVEDFMNEIYCKTLKAKSDSKSDIFIVIHDKRTNAIHELGFSIKSKLGAKSTLLNAAGTTNFIYSIEHFNPTFEQLTLINDINTKSKIKDRIEFIKNLGGVFKFSELENQNFKNNLVLVDSLLPNILAEILIQFFTTSNNTLADLTESIDKSNPLHYDQYAEHKFYNYKIKKFLTDVALGMTPSKVWSGVYDATGGYLIVKKTGEIFCYHIYNKNQFEDYLFNNTKLETASSTRHQFVKIYDENGKYFFKLNLQIRFK